MHHSRSLLRRLLLVLAAMACLCAMPASVSAGGSGLEDMLMPGQVVRAHAKTESTCSACHRSFDKNAQPALCLACHKDVAADLAARRGFHGRSAAKVCRNCHTDHKGRDAIIVKLDRNTFRHDVSTDFTLVGAHRAVACDRCHAPPAKFRAAASTCIGCHRDDDTHKGTLGRDCASCHAVTVWKEGKFDHSRTDFALRGRHAQARCAACHTRPLAEAKLGGECIDCHRKDDAHKGAMGSNCANCHTENGWKETKFDHSTTRFPLVGRHASALCSACHRQPNVFRGAPTDCVACHRKDDAHAGTLGDDCKHCHQARGWKPAPGFDHAKTSFSLFGKHREAACSGCHRGPKAFRGIAASCNDCHAKDDKHKGRNGTDCRSCHNAASWKQISFDHDKLTRFPLVGGHRPLACQACHKNDAHREKLDMQCASCHAAKDPHRGKLGNDCARCHVADAWKKVVVDHNRTAFPLLGRHQLAACTGCHQDKLYQGAPKACVGCHAKDDTHRGRMGSTCETCHNARAWSLWRFDHENETRFPLSGAHASLKCDSCHKTVQKDRIALPLACGSCHSGDDIHNGSFGNRCERCHTSTSFKDLLPAAR